MSVCSCWCSELVSLLKLCAYIHSVTTTDDVIVFDKADVIFVVLINPYF